MKKRKMYLLCAALVLAFLTACTPMAAAEGGPLVPVSVEETPGSGGTLRLTKVYELALTDSADQIPTSDFERDGCLYRYLDMTKENVAGVDTREYTESVTKDCKSNDTASALKLLDAERTVKTPDGYEGTLLLDHTSVKITVKGYKTNSKNITATRTYANLPDADLDLIPKSITENGNTLTLNDAQWKSSSEEDGELRFTATAEYTGTSTNRSATGYQVTANYTGHVVKTNCEMIRYTVIFAGTESPLPEETGEPPEDSSVPESGGTFSGGDWLSLAGCAGGIAAIGAAVWQGIQTVKERRKKT